MQRVICFTRGSVTRRFELEEGQRLVLGSAPTADLCLQAPGVGPAHCAVQATAEGLQLERVDPAGGLGIGAHGVLATSALVSGDHLLIGGTDDRSRSMGWAPHPKQGALSIRVAFTGCRLQRCRFCVVQTVGRETSPICDDCCMMETRIGGRKSQVTRPTPWTAEGELSKTRSLAALLEHLALALEVTQVGVSAPGCRGYLVLVEGRLRAALVGERTGLVGALELLGAEGQGEYRLSSVPAGFEPQLDLDLLDLIEAHGRSRAAR